MNVNNCFNLIYHSANKNDNYGCLQLDVISYACFCKVRI